MLIVVALGGASSAAYAGEVTGAAAGAYGASGRWLTGPDGRVFIASGVNLVTKRPPYSPAAWGFGADDAALLREHGVDVVRLGVIWKAVEPQPGVYDGGYLDSLVEISNVLHEAGIATLLDMHHDQFNERFRGAFAPDWAVLSDGAPNWNGAPFPLGYLTNPALMQALDGFLENRPGPGGVGLADRFAAMWGQVAQRFAGEPGVLGYDLWNEPMPGTDWSGCLVGGRCARVAANLDLLHHKAASAIRQVAPGGVIFAEPLASSAFAAPVVGRVPRGVGAAGISFHSYCPFAILSGRQFGCDPGEELLMRRAEQAGRRQGAALLLTEWGATDAPDVLRAGIARAAKYRTGQIYWAYCGCDDPTSHDASGQGVVEDPSKPLMGSNVRWSKLKTLATPHPRWIAGTPSSYAFDPKQRTFRLRYVTARADGAGRFAAGAQSVVALPPAVYPDGYDVDVQGATAERDGANLVLRGAPSATTVQLVVRPRR